MRVLLRQYWWWWLSGLALLHQVLQKVFLVQIPFLHSYLDDVLCIPIFLGIWNWERSIWWGKTTLSISEILALVVLVFIVFEWVVPKYDARFTADYWDGAAYLLGAGLYLLLRDKSMVT